MINRTVRAFTVLEMAVVMVVAAITISMAYSVMAIMKNEWMVFEAQENNERETLTLLRLLNDDIEKSHCIKQYGNFALICYRDDDSLVYTFYPFIVRAANTIESFHIPVLKVQFDMVKDVPEERIVRHIALCLDTKPQLVLEVDKNYSSYDLIRSLNSSYRGHKADQ